jgi:hypothetical protein
MLRRGVLAVAVVGAVLAAGCSSKSDTKKPTTSSSTSTSSGATSTSSTGPTTTIAVSAAPSVDLDALSGSENGSFPYTYRVEFPKLRGLSPSTTQSRINDAIKAWASAQVDQFAHQAKGGAGADPGQGTSNLEGHSTTTAVDTRIASFRLVVSSYYAGAAHPGSVVKTFTFDLRTGGELQLADLFKKGDYLGFLSRRSLEQLHSREYGDGIDESGASANASNFAACDLPPTGMEVTCQEYQVGAYANGTPMVSFTTAELRPYAADAGPLAR